MPTMTMQSPSTTQYVPVDDDLERGSIVACLMFIRRWASYVDMNHMRGSIVAGAVVRIMGLAEARPYTLDDAVGEATRRIEAGIPLVGTRHLSRLADVLYRMQEEDFVGIARLANEAEMAPCLLEFPQLG